MFDPPERFNTRVFLHPLNVQHVSLSNGTSAIRNGNGTIGNALNQNVECGNAYDILA
jgi:hypothetical protein